MNAYVALFSVLAIATAVSGSALVAAPGAPLLHAPALLAPGAPLLQAPALLAPAPILTAPAVVGTAPVLLGHSAVAATHHIGAPIAARTLSAPVATYSTTHTLLGAPLAAPALLARPALPLAAPVLGAPLAAPALLARPALY